MKYVIAILSCLLFVAGAVAQDAPKGPAPTLKAVSSVDSAKGLIGFKEIYYVPVTVQREVEVIINGQKVKQIVNETRPVPEERIVQFDAGTCRFITPNGKKVAIDDVWKRVKANTVVVISGNSDAPAAEYLRVLSAETIVIIQGATKN